MDSTNNTPIIRVVTSSFIFLLLLLSCGGGGGGGDANSATISILFPTSFNTEADYISGSSINLSGRINNADPATSTVTVISSIDSKQATIDSEGNWAAKNLAVLADTSGQHITVSLQTSSGATATTSKRISTLPPFVSPHDIHIERFLNRAFVSDPGLGTIFVIDLNSGERSLPWNNPFSNQPFRDKLSCCFAFVRSISKELAYNDGFNSYRFNITDNSIHYSNNLWYVNGTELAARNNSLGTMFYVDRSELYSANFNNGSGGYIYHDKEVTGVHNSQLNDVVVNHSQYEVLASNVTYEEIISVNYLSLTKSVLSSASVGTGPSLTNINKLLVDANQDQLIANNGISILSIDLNNGNRSIISGDSRGEGPVFIQTENMALMPDGETIAVIDKRRKSLISVDQPSGDRAVLSSSNIGQGPYLDYINHLDYTVTNKELILAERTANAIFRIDTLSGDRSVISDVHRGTGPMFNNPRLLKAQEADDVIWLIDSDSLFEIDYMSGDRRLVYGAGIDPLQTLAGARDIVLDSSRNRVIVALADSIAAIDMQTGNMNELSGSVKGSGPSLNNLTNMAINESQLSLWVLQPNAQLLKVDLLTGNRILMVDSFVYSNASGSSALPTALRSISFCGSDKLLGQDGSRIFEIDTGSSQANVLTIPSIPFYRRTPTISSISNCKNDHIVYAADVTNHSILAIGLKSQDAVAISR